MFDNAKNKIDSNIVPGKKEGTSAAALKEVFNAVIDDTREAVGLAVDNVSPISIKPTTPLTELNTLPNAVYRAFGEGTYKFNPALQIVQGSAVNVIPLGYSVKFLKDANGWSVSVVEKLPIQDLTEIELSIDNLEQANINPNDYLTYFNEIGFINKALGFRDDSSSGSNYRSSYFLKIKDINNIKITGFSGASNSVAMVAFYDRSLNFLGIYNTSETGVVTNVTIPTENIPANSYYIKCSRRQDQIGVIEGVYLDSSIINTPNEDLYNSDLFTDIGFINKLNGDVDTSSPTYQSTRFLKIINKSYLFISYGFSGTTNRAALASFYDKNFNWISSYNAPTYGNVTNHRIDPSYIPDEAVYVKFTRTGATYSSIFGVDYKYKLGARDVESLVINSILTGLTKYNSLGGYINKSNGLFVDADSLYRVTNFYRILDRNNLFINNGFSGVNNSVALASFYDSKLNFISYYNTSTNGINTNVTIPTESIPTNALYVRFTTTLVETFSIKGAVRNRIDAIEIERLIAQKINSVNVFNIDNQLLYSEVGYIYKNNGMLDTSGVAYRSSLFLKIIDIENVIVTGFSGTTNRAALASFYDKNFNWISSYNAPTYGNVTNHRIDPSYIPDEAVYVKFTRYNSQGSNFSGVSTEFKPEDVLKLIDILNAKIPDVSNINTLRSGKPNPDKGGYLKFLNYLGNNQNIHPKVLYFENGFNNYKYWMAYTPYPNGNVEHENPCIAVSNDGMNWETPIGLTNPLELRPVTEQDPTAYNSDTHLVYNSDTLKLECWWRSYNGVTPCIKRRVSLNGINWEPTEIIFNYGGVAQVSQSIIYDNGIYKYWACDGIGKVIYTESSDVFNFPPFQDVPMDFSSSNLMPWHMDVIKTKKGLEFVFQCWEIGIGNNNTSDLYYVLHDDKGYSAPKLIVERGDMPNDDDYMGIYRASIVYHEYNEKSPRQGGYYYIYYSGLGRNYANRNIFLTAGRSVDRLRGVNL